MKIQITNITMRCTQSAMFRCCVLIFVTLFLQSCNSDNNSRSINTLNIAILPDQSKADIQKKYTPLVRYLQEYTGIKANLLVPDSYAQLLQWFQDKKIELAMFGGVTYVRAHYDYKAEPLVMRDVDGTLRSVALVRSSSSANKIQDMSGKKLAFGSVLSTTGHILPRYFLKKMEVIPENYFSDVVYSGSHDQTAEWVRDSKVDIGIANSGIVHDMFVDGRLNRRELSIIWQSPPLPDYVWAIQPDINRKQVTDIRNAFLSLSENIKKNFLLKELGAKYYIPAINSDFKLVENVVFERIKKGSVK